MSATLSSFTAPRSLAGSFFFLPPLPPLTLHAALRRGLEDEEYGGEHKCYPHLLLVLSLHLLFFLHFLLILLLLLLLLLRHSSRLLIFPPDSCSKNKMTHL